jgi:hypothetical protein
MTTTHSESRVAITENGCPFSSRVAPLRRGRGNFVDQS